MIIVRGSFVCLYMYICACISIVRNLRILYIEQIAIRENVVYSGRIGIIGRRLSLIIKEVRGGVFTYNHSCLFSV